jgi:membrane protein DedA with SNARE-associated domain
MNLETIVTIYGYPALLVGALMEGETIVIIAGFMAHSGHLYLPWVMLTAFAGAFTADQFFFQLGKRKGKAVLEKKPHWEQRVDRIRSFLVRYQVIAILGYRFIYGMRTITPIVIGASGFSTLRFVGLNFFSTVIWSILVSTAGYYFGHLFQKLLQDVHNYELVVMLIIAVCGVVIWLYRYRIRQR